MKKLFLLLITLLMVFSLSSCKKEEEPEVDPDEGKTVAMIEVDKSTVPEAMDTEEFDLSQIKVTITYEDLSTRVAGLQESWLSPDDLDFLKEGGTKRVSIYYKDCETKVNISTINYRALDPVIGSKELIVMVKRNESKDKCQVVFMTNTGLSSLQVCFKYDSTNFSIKTNTIKTNADYTVRYQLENDKIYIFLIANDTVNYTGEIAMLEFECEGNYRKANFEVDNSFSNKAIKYNGSEFITIDDITYHYSKR